MEASTWIALLALAGSVSAGLIACLGRIKNCKWCCCSMDVRAQQRGNDDTQPNMSGQLVEIIANLSRDKSGESEEEKKKKKGKKEESPTSPTTQTGKGSATHSFFSTSETEQEEKTPKAHSLAP